MPRTFTQSLAACAAVVLAFSSIASIVTVPPAHAMQSLGSIALA